MELQHIMWFTLLEIGLLPKGGFRCPNGGEALEKKMRGNVLSSLASTISITIIRSFLRIVK